MKATSGAIAYRAPIFGMMLVTCVAVGAVILLLRASDAPDLASALGVSGTDERFRLPWRPSLDEQYPSASECERCHPAQFAEWQESAHSRSAKNPLVHASVCGRCHAPLGTQFDAEYQLKLYDQTPMAGVPESAAEGITCIVCHATTHLPEEQLLTFEPEWPNWRTTDLALEILEFDTARGTFGAGTEDDPSPVPNDVHVSVADQKLSSAEMCRTCHDVVVDKEPFAPHCGLNQAQVALLTTYAEWAASPYAATGETCQSCHMPRHPDHEAAAVAPEGTEYERPLPGRGPASHSFTGVSSQLLESGPEVARQEDRVAEGLLDAAALEIRAPITVTLGSPLDVSVAITNTGAGHDLPTGFAYWSEAWLELLITDADGSVLFASGDVDEDGWLRDEFNARVIDGTLEYDAHLVSLRARLVSVGPNRNRWQQPDGTFQIPYDEVPRNLNGTPIIGADGDVAAAIVRQVHPEMPPPIAGYALREGHMLRFADTVVRNGIPAQQALRADFEAPIDPQSRGPVRVSARLLIRSQWPWMLLQQQELPTPRPRPRIYEIASALSTVSVVEP